LNKLFIIENNIKKYKMNYEEENEEAEYAKLLISKGYLK